MYGAEQIGAFLEKARSCDVLFVGGIDRSGTTKVGHLLGCLDFKVIQEVSSITANLILSEVSDSGGSKLEKKVLALSEYYSYLNKFQTQSKYEKFKCFYHEVYNVKGKFIETSPVNLEMYHLLRELDLNVCFIFLKRDINDLWVSYKTLSWGPISFSELTKEVERKLLQINGLRGADDVLVIDYSEIGILEQLVPAESFELDKHEIPEFTRAQHKLVLEPFKKVTHKMSSIDAYAAGRSYISSKPRQPFSFLCEIQIIVCDVARIFKKKFLRILTRY